MSNVDVGGWNGMISNVLFLRGNQADVRYRCCNIVGFCGAEAKRTTLTIHDDDLDQAIQSQFHSSANIAATR